jgi:hypothetical protein
MTAPEMSPLPIWPSPPVSDPTMTAPAAKNTRAMVPMNSHA